MTHGLETMVRLNEEAARRMQKDRKEKPQTPPANNYKHSYYSARRHSEMIPAELIADTVSIQYPGAQEYSR